MTKAKKRIMRDFRLDEISAVTVPAQEGALKVIMKRGDQSPEAIAHAERVRKIIAKGKYKLTTAVNGHSHLIEVDEYAIMRGGGKTEWVGDYEQPGRHAHPFVINADGSITIGETNGHSHEIMADASAMEKGADGPPADGGLTQKDGEAMTPEQLAEFEKFKALALMSDAQKAHYAKLAGDDAAAFLKADSAARDAIVAKAASEAAGDDPVVFKSSLTGIEYRKSAGEAMIAMAKTVDGLMSKLDAVTAEKSEGEAKALADSWTHVGKSAEEKLAIAKAILALPADAQKAAKEAMNFGKDGVKVLFQNLGALNGGNAATKTAEGELNELAKEAAKNFGGDFNKGLNHVLDTPRGAELYEKSLTQH